MFGRFTLSSRTLAKFTAAIVGASALAIGVSHVRGDAAKSQTTIKDIMKAEHKGDDSVVKQIIAGKGTQAEIDHLLADYKLMAELTPPRGDKESWKAKTGKLIAITSTLKPDDKEGLASFKTAVTCKACHEVHKPLKKNP